jgi:hypothetical protein
MLSLGAVGCVKLDAKVNGIVADAPDQMFPGAGAAAGRETSMSFSLPLKQGNGLVSEVATAQVQSVRFAPKSGVTSLDFFRMATVTLKADGAPDLTVLDIGPDQIKVAKDGSVTIPVILDIDAKRYLVDSLQVDATIDILAPAGDWSLGTQITLDVEAGTTIKL